MPNKIQKAGKAFNAAEDLTKEGLNRALDIIRGDTNLSKDLALAEKTIPQELMPLFGISQGKARGLILPGNYTTSLNELYNPDTIGADFMDANKTLQNLNLLGPDALRKLRNVEDYSAPLGNGQIGIINDARKRYPQFDEGSPNVIPYTHVSPLADLFHEMSVQSLINNGVLPDSQIPLFRKFYPLANTGEGKKPVLSFSRRPDVLTTPRFNAAMSYYGDDVNDVVQAPIQVYSGNMNDIVGSDLVLPRGGHYDEAELQANKNAIKRIGSISPTTGEPYDMNGKISSDIVDFLLENGIDLYNLPPGFGHSL